MDEITVLIVDDSALMRNFVSQVIEHTKGLAIAGKARNGADALEKIPQLNPDIIVLDLEMPVMNGVQFMHERKKRGIEIPVVVLSSIAHKGAAVTIECLELGASDFILKPTGMDSNETNEIATRLSHLMQTYGLAYARKKGKKATLPTSITKMAEYEAPAVQKSLFPLRRSTEPAPPITPIRPATTIEIIGLGISTGGPNALREVFPLLSPEITQPILVVQHMPAGFTKEFALSLDKICPLEVKEAEEGDILKPGRILIAPGNKHMRVEVRTLASIVHLSDDEARNGHRPSVDVLFESIATQYQNKALGIIMTGMGKDGARQLAEMRRQGARTLGQDEESSIVYGMPKVAFELGAVEKQVPLANMANAINEIVLAV